MRNYWSLNRKEVFFFILFVSLALGTAWGLHVLSSNYSGASFVTPITASGDTGHTVVCSVSAGLKVAFEDGAGELNLYAAKYRTEAGGFAYKGSGYLTSPGKRYTISSITKTDCALPTQELDGTLSRSVIHIEATGTLAGETAPSPLILNLAYTPDGSPKIDSFTVISEEEATSPDWFGTNLAASGSLITSQAALTPASAVQ